MSNEAELILNAFVDEAHKDIADFMNVTPVRLDISEESFYKALKELEIMGCVKDIQWCPDGECLYDDIEIDTANFKLHK